MSTPTRPGVRRRAASGSALFAVLALVIAAAFLVSSARSATMVVARDRALRASSTPIYLPNCSTTEFGGSIAPREWSAGCASGDTWSTMTWHHWGERQAWGTGIQPSNDCVPDCAGGHITNVPVKVVVWQIRQCRGGPRWLTGRYYTRDAIGPVSASIASLKQPRYGLVPITCDPPTPYRSLLLSTLHASGNPVGELLIGTYRIRSDFTLNAIVRALGPPSDCSPNGGSLAEFAGNREARWDIGIHVYFYSDNSRAWQPPNGHDWQGCIAAATSYPPVIFSFSENRWHTPAGVGIGDSMASFHRRCPSAPPPQIFSTKNRPFFPTCDTPPALSFTLSAGRTGVIEQFSIGLPELAQ